MTIPERFTAIPHAMLEKLFRARLSPAAWEILAVFLRYILGFNRESHSLSISFLARATGRHRNVVRDGLQELTNRQIIRRHREATFCLPVSWAFRPPGEWKAAPSKVTGTFQGTSQLNQESSEADTSEDTRRGTSSSAPEVPPAVHGQVPPAVPKRQKREKSFREKREGAENVRVCLGGGNGKHTHAISDFDSQEERISPGQIAYTISCTDRPFIISRKQVSAWQEGYDYDIRGRVRKVAGFLAETRIPSSKIQHFIVKALDDPNCPPEKIGREIAQ